MLNYKEALQWLLCNDDCGWLSDTKPSLSVSAALIAAIYKKTKGEIINDMNAIDTGGNNV